MPALHQKDPLPARKIHAPYNVPWTGHLIKRDLKDLKDKIKAKTKAKFDKLLGNSRPASEDSAKAFYISDKFAIRSSSSSRDDDKQDYPYPTRQEKLEGRDRMIYMRQNGGALSPTFKNPMIQMASSGLDINFVDRVHFVEKEETDKEEKSVYEILTACLDSFWKDRPKDEEHAKEYITHEERFRTRGVCVLLRLFLENCPSNPMFVDLNKGQECFDEVAFKLALSEEVNVIKLKAILSNLTRYQVKSSKMPGELNHKRLSSVHLRIDSLLTEEEQAKQIDEQITAAVIPSSLDLWYALMVACSERSFAQKVVESLLHLVEPEMDVDKLLIRIGNPAQMVPTDEKNFLRKKLLQYFFPEFDDLS